MATLHFCQAITVPIISSMNDPRTGRVKLGPISSGHDGGSCKTATEYDDNNNDNNIKRTDPPRDDTPRVFSFAIFLSSLAGIDSR